MNFKKILKWAGRRATEKSTYVGLATIATVLGVPGVAAQIGQIGQIVGLIVGAGAMAATTSVHAPTAEPA
jgi:hypothetical protein